MLASLGKASSSGRAPRNLSLWESELSVSGVSWRGGMGFGGEPVKPVNLRAMVVGGVSSFARLLMLLLLLYRRVSKLEKGIEGR
jgi:hypothetical protein